MKILSVSFSCALLCCNAVMAEFIGSDDFNEGEINTNLWKSGLNPGDPDWEEWVKPGFFMVKWIDGVGGTNEAPVVYELQSWSDE